MNDRKRSRTNIKIYNQTYTIVGKESEEHMELVAKLVDEKMREVHQANQQLDITRLAVLTAVNTMNDYVKLKEKYTAMLDTLNREEEK